MAKSLALVLLLLGAGAAWAQAGAPPAAGEPETVYSDAQRQKDDQLSRRFVQSLLSPSKTLDGQFSRWKSPICPRVMGVAPAAAYMVEKRIRDVAQEVGAPLDRSDPCAPDIVIFVTDRQQMLLDAMVAKDHWLFDAGDMTVRYPVQAWYMNFVRDYNGRLHMDVPWESICPDCGTSAEHPPPPLPANDTWLHTGIQAQMGTAVILADTAAISGLTLGSFGDYLALMVLAQTPATGRCQPAPSIANLFLKDCDADFHTTALSDVDLAMLTALYQTPDEPEKLQAMRLIANMRRDLEGQARK
jgi:hypothetical protein